jgi:hypothetical protein
MLRGLQPVYVNKITTFKNKFCYTPPVLRKLTNATLQRKPHGDKSTP